MIKSAFHSCRLISVVLCVVAVGCASNNKKDASEVPLPSSTGTTSAAPAEPLPAPAPVATSQAAPVASGKTYTVQKGDSLWKIANKNHAHVEDIKKLNNLNSEMLHPGQVLQLP